MAPESSNAERVKAQQVQHWDSVARGWAVWLEWTERYFTPVTEWFAERAVWVPGVRALDVACGPGYPTFAGASRVGPAGTQVGIDISPRMIAAASERARAAGVRNVEFVEMDAEDLRFEDGCFDTVTNAYGLMFCPDPQQALTEAHRVLKVGGRLAVTTWDEPVKSPFFTVITSVAVPILSLAVPDRDAPSPFRLASAARLEAMLHAAGFSEVRVERRSMTLEFASVTEYCQIFADVAWMSRIARLSSADYARFQDAVGRAVQPFTRDGCLSLDAASLCACGQKI